LPIQLPLKSEKEADMMSLTIRQGKLDARFRSSPAEVLSITSSGTYNDGQFHNVVVVRTGRKVEVLVDDISIGTIRLARQVAGSSSSSSADFSHLMLGGVRPEWLSMASDFIGTQHSFTGCIADLSFNNQLVDLSYPVRHSAAAVGRCQHVPVPRMLEERMQANENALSSCREVPQYTIEGRAFKFGDAPNSHVMISANRKELHNSFNFTMDFRTHYPNGLLLFSSVRIFVIFKLD
jgi:laminin alpha 1/2